MPPSAPPIDAPLGLTEEERRAMLRAVVNLFDKWELSEEEGRGLLGGVSDQTFQRWNAGETCLLWNGAAFRISELLRIYVALRYIFCDATQSYGWIRRMNAAFGGKSPLDLMLQGSLADIGRVRSYLEAEATT
jgi:uncharacterized protein (DUF2384 family)